MYLSNISYLLWPLQNLGALVSALWLILLAIYILQFLVLALGPRPHFGWKKFQRFGSNRYHYNPINTSKQISVCKSKMHFLKLFEWQNKLIFAILSYQYFRDFICSLTLTEYSPNIHKWCPSKLYKNLPPPSVWYMSRKGPLIGMEADGVACRGF